jgi:hypothetical protein
MALVKANKEKEEEQRRLQTFKQSPVKSAATPTASSNHEQRHDA